MFNKLKDNSKVRFKNKTDFKHSLEHTVESLIEVIELGDITECFVTINDINYKTGKSADYDHKSGFFDTEYYINEVSYVDMEDYVKHLKRLITLEGMEVYKIIVHEIDGGKPYYAHLQCNV